MQHPEKLALLIQNNSKLFGTIQIELDRLENLCNFLTFLLPSIQTPPEKLAALANTYLLDVLQEVDTIYFNSDHQKFEVKK